MSYSPMVCVWPARARGRLANKPLGPVLWAHSPKCLEEEFCELRLYEVLGSWAGGRVRRIPTWCTLGTRRRTAKLGDPHDRQRYLAAYRTGHHRPGPRLLGDSA